MVEIRTIS
ncbi:unnamed protein product [Callosobruchus maculatus]|uniref:Uncharacterized protein n=1 Tax=Callosobruchus maculatus TaxID=64391 RepID=A0A653BVW3_CALMS|nr:unnamed protein product [Callosobruchus maculatus]